MFFCLTFGVHIILTSVSTRTYDNEYTHLLKYLRVSTEVFACAYQWNLTKTPN